MASPLCERARDRELRLAERERIRGTALDERHRLQRLDGRARKDGTLDIAEREYHASLGIRDGDRAAMNALDQRTTHHLDKDRIVEP